MNSEEEARFDTDIEGESRNFDYLKSLAESNFATPGEAFEIIATLTVDGNRINVTHDEHPLGYIEHADELANTIDGPADVPARVWTCHDWDDFYASVRLDTEELFIAKAEYDDFLMRTYGTTTPDLETTQRVAAASADPVESANWEVLLAPDGSKRATPFQRGFVRGKIGHHFPNNRAPRMDYLTVGQAYRVLEHFREDASGLEKSGRGSMLLWWLLISLLNFAFLLFSFFGFGLVLFAIEAAFVVHHFVTRSKLEPPFSKRR